MKTNTEIMSTWETEGQYTDWYAIDNYNPIDCTENRLFVGTYDDAVKRLADYTEPTDYAMQPFYRCSPIGSEEAHDFFAGIGERLTIGATEAADVLGVSRMRVNQLLNDGKLEGYKANGTWRVYRRSVEDRLASTRKPFEMYELEAYLGDFAGDFDVDAIVDEATYVDPRTGNRYWREGVDLNEVCARHDATA